jgi:protein-tyrosine phosphatase
MPSTPFTLVYMCTANRARSPVAAAITRRLLGDAVVVRSCGTRAREGLPPLPGAVLAAEKVGIDISGHRSSLLERAGVEDADLVVGFERIHVATAIVDGGAPRGRTFTLHELASLLLQPPAGPSRNDADPVARARRLVADAGTRSRADAALPRELVDPVGRPQRVFDEVALEIDGLTRRIVYSLFGLV